MLNPAATCKGISHPQSHAGGEPFVYGRTPNRVILQRSSALLHVPGVSALRSIFAKVQNGVKRKILENSLTKRAAHITIEGLKGRCGEQLRLNHPGACEFAQPVYDVYRRRH